MSSEAVEVLEEKLGKHGYVIILIAVALTLFPIFWMLMTSLKPQGEWLTRPPTWLPSKLELSNYKILFTGGAYGGGLGSTFVLRMMPATKAMIDSAILTTFGTVLSIIIGLLAAFGISRHRIGGNFFPLFVLSARMIPPVCVLIPIIILYSTLHLVDTYIGLIMAYALFTSPYSVWMIRSFIDEVPRQLEESAMVDGLTPLGAHFKVTLPLIKGGVFATALFIAVLNWSEFLFALTLSHERIITIPVQETYFVGSLAVLYGPQSALGVIAIIPLIVFGYSIQKYLARGLTFGAVKR
ncbi:MAG: carbohydrate ABC transporter permease [Nitrososphaerota archaeon]